MRVKPADFQKLDLRCHALLSDVSLHDVWAISLNGGGPGRSIQDARAILFGDRRSSNVAVRGLFALRSALGRAFGWDDERHDPPGMSYVHRLTEADRSRSQVPPGTREGPFRVLYVLGACEALSELRNATVHAFLALALTPRPGGYTLYLAVYVKPVSRFSTLYMALIDPFRRLVVYPALGRHAQQRWSRTYA
jgi:hypothetical protein